jgi:hypothetical protein
MLASIAIAIFRPFSQHRSKLRDQAAHSATLFGFAPATSIIPATIPGTARLAGVTKTGASAAALQHDGHSTSAILAGQQARQQALAPATLSTTLFR